MEEQTQAVDRLEDDDATDIEEEEEDTSNSAHPMAYLRVLAHNDVEQTDFPIADGMHAVNVYTPNWNLHT